jgi:hypothetical protein
MSALVSTKIAKQFEIIMTNVHEAAHAIYALLHFMKVNSVIVFTSKEINGITNYNDVYDLDIIKNKQLLKTIVKIEIGVCYAGLAAEKILFNSLSGSLRTPHFISCGSTDDNKIASQYIKKYNMAVPGIKRSNFKNKILKEVNKDLISFWDDVVLVSHSLFKEKSLNYEQLKNVLINSVNKEFWIEQFEEIEYCYYYDVNEKYIKELLNYAKDRKCRITRLGKSNI